MRNAIQQKNARCFAKKADHGSLFEPNKPSMKKTAIFTHRSTREMLSVALVLLLASFTALTATAASSRPRLAAPAGTCNLPPIPAPGQTVTWTLAGSPYEICQNITIPSTSTVIVEAGVHINFDPDMQVVVLGTMRTSGTGRAAHRATGTGCFPADHRH